MLERHAGYFFKDRPQFERIVVRIYADATAVALALERGEVDFVPQLGMRASDARKLLQG